GGSLTVSGTNNLVAATIAQPLAPIGTMLAVSGGNISIPGTVINATGDAALVFAASAINDPVIALSGAGTRNLATDSNASIFKITGTLAADEPIQLQAGQGLLQVTGGSVTTNRLLD